MAGSFEHATDPSGSLKGGKYSDQWSDHLLLKKVLLHGVRYQPLLLEVGNNDSDIGD